MKKFLIILTVFLLICTVGCNEAETVSGTVSEEAAVVKMPEDDSVNGYRESDKNESEADSDTSSASRPLKNQNLLYYANKNSKTFHFSTCGTGKRIKNDNLYITESRDELIAEGYKPCSNCKP